MRVPRRPAWPVVFLLASRICTATDPVEALSAEIVRWHRIQAPESTEATEELHRAHAEATAAWVERWPGEELAWRERLRALQRVSATPAEVGEALDGALRTRGRAPGLRFPEDTRFLAAQVAVRHGVRTVESGSWLTEAVDDLVKALPAGDHPLVGAYRKERLSRARWRAAEIRAEAAWGAQHAYELGLEVIALTSESAVPVADTADRLAVAERARRRAAVFLWRARLAKLQGRAGEAASYYERALRSRPVTPGDAEPPENLALLHEARDSGLQAGAGSPIPPAMRAAPHWLPTAQQLEGFVSDGRPAVAVIWDTADPSLARGIERLGRNAAVRLILFSDAAPGWIQAFNPLYTAPQLWVVDPAGTIRLVGRFQPGGDGWEDAVTGAALRLDRR